jgi:uroporphyrinogen decarboxylase
VIYSIGDDFGTQRGLLFGVKQWSEFFRPSMRRLADIAHAHGAFYYQHSCGGIRELIPEMISVGVDVIDPVQVSARGMEPAALKTDFGSQIVFSGGVDEQELLRRGTPAMVREGVFDLLNKMAVHGGFFIGPTHNFQTDIPTENIAAMYAAAKEWRPR